MAHFDEGQRDRHRGSGHAPSGYPPGQGLDGHILSDIVLQVLSFVAENERANIKQRQAEGIAAAQARGVRFGRPPRPLPDNFDEVCRDWQDKKITLRQAAAACQMPVGTFYDHATNRKRK